MDQNIAAVPCTALTVASTRTNWKWFQRGALVALAVLGTGCSGIHASKSISPLDFILPGIMKNETPANGLPAEDSLANVANGTKKAA